MQAYKTSQGNWQVDFSEQGKQKTLYLGRDYTKSSADRTAGIVAEILSCRKRGETLPADIVQKIKSLPLRLRKSFERLGLVGNAANWTLEKLLSDFYEARNHLKQNTLSCYKNVGRLLLEFFDGHQGIELIEKADCERFVNQHLKYFKPSTLSRAVRRCRTIFSFAVDKGWLYKSPFDIKVKRVDVNLDRQVYVDRDTIYKVMSCCVNDYDRLLLALARFGGLRIPSEVKLLRYEDFTESVIRIHEDTKTGAREVPLFCEIRECFDRIGKKSCPTDFVFASMGSFRYRIISAIRACGVECWEKLFVNLRSSCITDCVELGYSEKMLDSMFGNSSSVRSLHYIQFRREKEYERVLLENARLHKLRMEHCGNEDLTDDEFGELLILRNLLVNRFTACKKAV